jgi:hypothetical protein
MIKEKRQHLRTRHEESVKVDVISEGATEPPVTLDCFSRDFSHKGIRLHGHTTFNLNSHVNLVVHMSAEKRDYKLHGTIKWVTETTEHEVLAGVELLPNQGSDLTHWQAKFVE